MSHVTHHRCLEGSSWIIEWTKPERHFWKGIRLDYRISEKGAVCDSPNCSLFACLLRLHESSPGKSPGSWVSPCVSPKVDQNRPQRLRPTISEWFEAIHNSRTFNCVLSVTLTIPGILQVWGHILSSSCVSQIILPSEKLRKRNSIAVMLGWVWSLIAWALVGHVAPTWWRLTIIIPSNHHLWFDSYHLGSVNSAARLLSLLMCSFFHGVGVRSQIWRWLFLPLNGHWNRTAPWEFRHEAYELLAVGTHI